MVALAASGSSQSEGDDYMDDYTDEYMEVGEVANDQVVG